jgi:hypothetical protein
LFAVAILGIAAARAGSDTTHQGVVKSMEASKLVLTTSTKELVFKINASTQISLDGKPAKAGDVQMGDYAAVTTSVKADAAAVASRIDAQRGSTPGTPDPLPR